MPVKFNPLIHSGFDFAGSGGGGSGTVTSVGLADSTGLFNITGSPVTTTGTLTLASFINQTQNKVFASPNGSTGAPAFRALVLADLPATGLTQGQIVFPGVAGVLSGSPNLFWDNANRRLSVGLSHTMGGTGSSAFGNGNTATGNFSFAEGKSNTASGVASHVEGGVDTDGSTSTPNIAAAVSSHAEGSANTIDLDAFAAHAEGATNIMTANAAYSHAEGSLNTVDAQYAHAEGQSNSVTGTYGHVEGNLTQAQGVASHAEGESTIASGEASHSEGSSTQANGVSSHAEGNASIAGSDFAHAEGNTTTASGQSSHSEGADTIASGLTAHAEGSASEAQGDASHAGGDTSIAEGTNSFAHGEGAYAQALNQIAVGRFNVKQGTAGSLVVGDDAFIVGNGTNDGLRSNAFSVGNDGLITMNKGGKRVRSRIDSGTTVTVNARTDYWVGFSNTGTVSINLPAGVSGMEYVIKATTATPGAASAIFRNGTDTIEGATSLLINKPFQGYILTFQTGVWYVSDESSSISSGSYNVQKYTLNGTDISNKFVTLSTTPTTANLTCLTVIGGIEQDYSVDFTVSGTQLSWSGLGLDGVLVSGDKLVVTYN